MSKTEPSALAAKITKGDAALRSELTAEPYEVLRLRGMELPGTLPLTRAKRDGVLACAGGATDLFVFEAKLEARRDWPSFDKPITAHAVGEPADPLPVTRRIAVRAALKFRQEDG